MMKYTCPICGYKTLDYLHEYDICPICFWEDDSIVEGNDSYSSPNRMRVSEAQANFIVFRCSSRRFASHVREPLTGEVLDPDWRPLPEALVLADSLRS